MGQAGSNLSVGKFYIETTRLYVDDDSISLAQSGNGAAKRGFGRDMTDHQSARRAAEAAIGEECDLLAQSGTHDSTGNSQHLAHARSTTRPLKANNHDITGLDLAMGHCAHGIFLAVEDARRSPVVQPLVTGNLDPAAL